MAIESEQSKLVPLTPDDEATFEQARHHYLRVSTQGAGRMGISTFLAGLTFAAYVAVLTAPPLTRSLSADQILLAISRAAMSVAAVLFLLTAASIFAALQLLANVSPSAAKSLGDGTPRKLDQRDVDRLRDAYEIYMTPSHWIPWGLVVLLVSLPLVGWRTHPLIGLATLVVMLFLVVFLRRLISVAVAGLLRQSQ